MWWDNWNKEQKDNPLAAKIETEGFWSKTLKVKCSLCGRETIHDIGFLDRLLDSFVTCGDAYAQTVPGGCGEPMILPKRPGSPNHYNLPKAKVSSVGFFSKKKKIKCPYNCCGYEKIVDSNYFQPVDVCESCLDWFAMANFMR